MEYLLTSAAKAPLPIEEELELVRKAKLGDTTARDKVVLHNLRLVQYIAKDYVSGNIEFDDLVSAGVLGLLRALNTFDIQEKVRFGTYASHFIRHDIFVVLELFKTSHRNISQLLPPDFESITDFFSIYEACDTTESVETVSKNMHAALETLPPIYKIIIKKSFGIDFEKESLIEIAQEFGKSKEWVRHRLKKGLKQLKETYFRLFM